MTALPTVKEVLLDFADLFIPVGRSVTGRAPANEHEAKTSPRLHSISTVDEQFMAEAEYFRSGTGESARLTREILRKVDRMKAYLSATKP